MIDNDFIYLDYNATTPVDQRVVNVMLPYFNNLFEFVSIKKKLL